MNNINKAIIRAMWEQSYAMSKLIDKLLIDNYPTKRIYERVKELNYINNEFMGLFSDLYNSKNDISQIQIKLYNVLLQRLYSIVGSFLYANIHDHPLEVMIPVKEIITKIGYNTDLITIPSWEMNYGIGEIWEGFDKALRNEGICDASNEQLILMIFPTLHKDNVLLGCIMGHELGHFLDLHYGSSITQHLLPKILMHKNVDILATSLSADEQRFSKYILKIVIKGILSKMVLKDWLSELVADVSGIVLYGPSSLFSSEQLLMYTNVSDTTNLTDYYTSSHPRNQIRNELRIKTLDKLGYKEVCPENIKNMVNDFKKAWKNSRVRTLEFPYFESLDIATFKFNFTSYTYPLIEQMLLENLDLIIDTTIKMIPKKIHYDAKRVRTEVIPLCKKICNFIPPNEIDNKSVSSISILIPGMRVVQLLLYEIDNPASEGYIDFDFSKYICNIHAIESAINEDRDLETLEKMNISTQWK